MVNYRFVFGEIKTVSIISSGTSAIGRLAALGLLLGVFLFGLVGVVYMALQGVEIKVPEITGKDVHESEKELASLGLKMKKRADRVSGERPDTVIEQLPKPGETVKTGQMIYVVTSKGGGDADAPASLKNTTEEDDAAKIEEMISDKPKKPKANSNSNRKKADTARDVNSDISNTSNSNSNSSTTNSNKKEASSSNNSTDKPNKNTQTPVAPKPEKPGTKPSASDAKPKPVVKP